MANHVQAIAHHPVHVLRPVCAKRRAIRAVDDNASCPRGHPRRVEPIQSDLNVRTVSRDRTVAI